MAGRGPAPKDPSRRARRNADPNPTIRLEFQRCKPPDLPDAYPWHPMTQQWWRSWQESPMAEIMGVTDWQFLLDTALLHSQMWDNGHWTLAAEVRLRVSKFGATPEDRLRLRIQWADADERDAEVPQVKSVPSRQRYGQLRALPAPSPSKDTE